MGLLYGRGPMAAHDEGSMLETILGYMSKIEGVRKIDAVLILLSEMGRVLVNADRCTLWLLDTQKKELWTKVAHGIDRVHMPAGSGIAGVAVGSGETVIVNDPYRDPRFNQEIDRKTGYTTRSILVVPIKNSRGEVLGAFQTINKQTAAGKFEESDIKYLKLASTYAGEAIEAAKLNEEIEETQRDVIFALAEAGETRSKETGNHVQRVSEYCRSLALLACLPKKEAELLKLAAPMHDIGKIAIPDAILLKPGRLDPEEFAVMKTHAESGYTILKGSARPILKAAATVAREHHERYDGTGYPRGLKGNDIHIFGRICAIADVFDALGSDRVYKKAWPIEKIVEEFTAQRGAQFDPALIDTFLAHLDQFTAIRERLKDI